MQKIELLTDLGEFSSLDRKSVDYRIEMPKAPKQREKNMKIKKKLEVSVASS